MSGNSPRAQLLQLPSPGTFAKLPPNRQPTHVQPPSEGLTLTVSEVPEVTPTRTRKRSSNHQVDIKAVIPPLELPPEPIGRPMESPIRAKLPSQILASFYAESKGPRKRILEFRKKKVINSEDKKYLELLESQNYDAIIRTPGKLVLTKAKPASVFREECALVKSIKKSGVVRKVANFWVLSTQQYPCVYKKTFRNAKTRTTFECFDLTKHLFGDSTAFHANADSTQSPRTVL